MLEPIASRRLRTDREGISLSPIKEMELRAAAIPGVISLAQGIPSFPTPAVIVRRAIDALEQGKAGRYSLVTGLAQLREAIEQHLAADGILYDFEEEILVTVGAIEAITATLLAILSPGDEVLLPNPCYASYAEAIRVAHGIPVWVALDERRGWGFDVQRLERAITPRTKAIIITNPNNPTGTTYTEEDLLAVAELAERHDFFILSDEVYKDIVFLAAGGPASRTDGHDYPTLARHSEFRERFVYVFSFSKSYAMTGWRIGFLAASKSVLREIRKVHDALVTCAPVVSQYAALAALELAQSDLEEYRRSYEQRRNVITQWMDAMPEAFSYAQPVAAYYLFPKLLLPHESVRIFAFELLEQAHVAVVPGSAFGPEGEGHIRLCFARGLEDIDEGMRRMKRFVEKLEMRN